MKHRAKMAYLKAKDNFGSIKALFTKTTKAALI